MWQKEDDGATGSPQALVSEKQKRHAIARRFCQEEEKREEEKYLVGCLSYLIDGATFAILTSEFPFLQQKNPACV